MIKRAYQFRFYPNAEQEVLLAQTFGCVRVVSNVVLKYRTDAYHECQEKVSYQGASAYLTAIKKLPQYSWLNAVSSVPLQQALRHQQTAFKNFFQARARYPKFKKKRGHQSAEFTRAAFKYRDGKLTLAKCNTPLAVRWSRKIPSDPSTITVSKDAAGRYFVSLLCEEHPKRLKVVKQQVGIDVGLTSLVTLSNGQKEPNPKHTQRWANKLARYQRRLSKKKLGSKNRAKARLKVARIHAKTSDCRRDALHQLSRRLINENQVVCVETLRVRNMMKNRALSKSIADAAWHEFTRQLAYKADWAGRRFVAIDQWFPSSKRCSTEGCGHVVESLPLGVREWVCAVCGAKHDRDINAALNILAAGLAVLACGENVSLV